MNFRNTYAGGYRRPANNWEVLLPLRNLRRLTLPEEAASSVRLDQVLARMTHVRSTVFVGPKSGDVFHKPDAPRGCRWIQCLSPAAEVDVDEEEEEEEENMENVVDESDEDDE